MSLSTPKALVQHAIEMEQIETTPTSSRESLDDPYRRELLWRPVLETLVNKSRETADVEALSHAEAAKKYRTLYHLFGLPAVLVPVVGAVVATHIPQAAVTALLLISGVASAINSFLDLGAKTQRHFEFSTRWEDLSHNVSYELAKPRAFRVAADVFLERLRNKTAALRATEPQC